MGLTNTYTGLIVPLIASATGTFFFRQFFKSVPDELLEAARIDGAGPSSSSSTSWSRCRAR
jgi:sn-glycerol 3-phosphate transport system permease protein